MNYDLIFEKDILENGFYIKEPWVVHKASAVLNKEEIGYLKVSFIPRQKCKKYWPDIWAFAEKELGHYWLEQLKTTEQRYNRMSNYWKCSKGCKTNKEKLKEINYWISKFEKQFKYYKSYFVDKPLVDFIRVNEKYQRQGIGKSLYVLTAKELAKDGLVLCASTNQSPSAKACWEYMELHDFQIKKENGRKFLDYRQI